jgi:redox-sensitive bicupin YhaK (pirin superfamily)
LSEEIDFVIRFRKSAERGHVNHQWLDSFHTFSFSDFYDPNFVHFSTLRVINEDRVNAGMGFETHPHKDMEIVTYVLAGALEHKDSMGTGSVIRPGDVQRMSAGTGVTHSEFNHSKIEPVHLLQIWIFPKVKNLKPSYEEKNFSRQSKINQLLLVGSEDGRSDSVKINQDVNLYASVLENGGALQYRNHPSRNAWLHVALGQMFVNEKELGAGDAIAITGEEFLEMRTDSSAEFLLFDLS